MPIFGIDWDGPMPPYLHDDDSSAVVIPATGCPWILRNYVMLSVLLLIVQIMGLIFMKKL